MKVRELIGRLVRETDLNDAITVFDMDGNEFKDLAVEKLGTNVYFYIKNRKKSDIEIREDFFTNA